MLKHYLRIAARNLSKNKKFSAINIFGLAAYSAEKRIKEVGIRKVLGASFRHIVIILSKDFLRYV
ncbi:MAG: hypothetical protein Q8941_07560, partial [Bacteroidota bacterium]|nr:hypothetical protein [Bacteroidota bacterium]